MTKQRKDTTDICGFKKRQTKYPIVLVIAVGKLPYAVAYAFIESVSWNTKTSRDNLEVLVSNSTDWACIRLQRSIGILARSSVGFLVPRVFEKSLSVIFFREVFRAIHRDSRKNISTTENLLPFARCLCSSMDRARLRRSRRYGFKSRQGHIISMTPLI